MAEEMKSYRLVSGKHSYVKGGERVDAKVGDLVPLTAAQYSSFKDKFVDPDAGQANGDEGAGEAGKSKPAPESKSSAPAPTTGKPGVNSQAPQAPNA